MPKRKTTPPRCSYCREGGHKVSSCGHHDILAFRDKCIEVRREVGYESFYRFLIRLATSPSTDVGLFRTFVACMMRYAGLTWSEVRESTCCDIFAAYIEGLLPPEEAVPHFKATMRLDQTKHDKEYKMQTLSCSVCYEDFPRKEFVSFECDPSKDVEHMFCLGCTLMVLKKTYVPTVIPSCPLCRVPIKSMKTLSLTTFQGIRDNNECRCPEHNRASCCSTPSTRRRRRVV